MALITVHELRMAAPEYNADDHGAASIQSHFSRLSEADRNQIQGLIQHIKENGLAVKAVVVRTQVVAQPPEPLMSINVEY